MSRIGRGQFAILAVLLGLLVMAVILAVSGWNSAGSADMTRAGWLAMGFGIFFSLIIGCGLMALMFFSSRSGYDEAADPFRGHELSEEKPPEMAADSPQKPADGPSTKLANRKR
ncbi:hypothetical protein [Bradyrhizobium embrapense]|uniref:hypothetical protein n=1 Tax=Bradyrhizobium embrapense TaxID=630921 RepID=UPI0007C4FCDE